MKKYIIIGIIAFALVILAVLINGFEERYFKISMIEKNPTSYIYDINIWELKKIIKNNFEDIKKELKCDDILAKMQDTSIVESKFLRKDSPTNQIMITSLVLNSIFVKSEIYYTKHGKAISYYAGFQINMQKLDESKTFVKIITLYSEISVKVNSIITHAPGFLNYYNVEPSTIEEYKILLVIGEKLGIRNEMPRIIIPEIPSK